MTELRPLQNMFATGIPENMKGNFIKLAGKYFIEAEPVKLGKSVIPPGIWQIILSTERYNQKQAELIVEKRELIGEGNYCFVNYNFEVDRVLFFTEPSESLDSLFRSNGLDEAENYLILKKIL